MMIDLILVDSDKITPEYLNEIERTLEDLCIHASKMERQADMAERIAERREILKMLAKNMDQEYEAIIVELGRKIKIRLAGVDTYIDSHDLKDIYRYDSKRKRYYDPEEKQHIKVGIGTKIYVKIINIDPINDKFNVKIVNTDNNCKKKVKKK
jgi:exoribonuclease R